MGNLLYFCFFMAACGFPGGQKKTTYIMDGIFGMPDGHMPGKCHDRTDRSSDRPAADAEQKMG